MPDVRVYHLYCASGDEEPRVYGHPASNATQWHVNVTQRMLEKELRCEIEAETRRGLSERVPFNTITPIRGGSRLEPPRTIAAEQTGAREITVTWSEVPGATAYFIARAAGKEGFRPVCQICPTTSTYVDRDVTADVTYNYMVAAVGVAGTSRRVSSGIVPVESTFGLASAAGDSAKSAADHGATSPTTSSGGTPRAGSGSTPRPGSSGTPGGTPNPPGGTPNPPGGTPRTSTPTSTPTTSAPTPQPQPARSCVLEYQRADNMWAAAGRPDGNLGTERLTLQAGQRRAFVTDWKYEKNRNDGSNYYGSHARIVKNAGQTPIALSISGDVVREDAVAMGITPGIIYALTSPPIMIEPGRSVRMKADLREASCDVK